MPQLVKNLTSELEEQCRKVLEDTEPLVKRIADFSRDWEEVHPDYDCPAKVPVLQKAYRYVRDMFHWKAFHNEHREHNEQFLKSVLPTDDELQNQKTRCFSFKNTFSILVPLYNTPKKYLREMLNSVQLQTYTGWQLCLADGSDDRHSYVGKICREYAVSDSRIVYQKLKTNGGISANTNACFRMATGEYVALLDHDDILHPSVLYWVMDTIKRTNADFIYTDEMTFDGNDLTKILSINRKPDFDPVMLNGVNYICHFTTFKRDLVDETGLFRDEYDGSQDHDMVLRLTAVANRIEHIPKILYFWRSHPMSTAADISAKPYAIDAGRRAVRDSEARKGRRVIVHSSSVTPTHYRLDYLMEEEPKVTIILTECNSIKDLIVCLYVIQNRTNYRNFDAILLTKESSFESIKKYLTSYVNCYPINYDDAVSEEDISDVEKKINSDFFIVLNAKKIVLTKNWIHDLVMFADLPEVNSVEVRIINCNGFDLEGNPIEYPGYMGKNCYAHLEEKSVDDHRSFDEYAVLNESVLCKKKGDKCHLKTVINPYVIVLEKRA